MIWPHMSAFIASQIIPEDAEFLFVIKVVYIIIYKDQRF